MTALSDIKVLETGSMLAGPFCGSLLGDFGAEVIKLEKPGKPDALREWRQSGLQLFERFAQRRRPAVHRGLDDVEIAPVQRDEASVSLAREHAVGQVEVMALESCAIREK